MQRPGRIPGLFWLQVAAYHRDGSAALHGAKGKKKGGVTPARMRTYPYWTRRYTMSLRRFCDHAPSSCP
jgi:hypothetical protein